ncbi:bis(5'-nucleosyl)-tetraphosphatase (symmetrical) YqeK [Xylocopilactobacillus apicola]|uniref:bis(5'-nucleosyl)-tetraphosphatase (symmetrical) n=1 Tax=Xylocopilactobacillus apicola TaxID=2932184 RepID=A0AAU9D7G0_9LACO|nr:bis(5'-nucleosyl)-tetraphosphatase (symmetrical) YqeK [Xylocopilactobacillus apicola]BDR58316.1 HD domain-containing protein [Xylocopilactobacillus apicola]
MVCDQFSYFSELAKQKLTAKRFDHCLNVAKTAKSLAEENGVDPQKARLAGLLHDFYKETDSEVFVEMIKNGHYDSDLLSYSRGVWHGLLGADLLKQEYEFYDEEILNAIRYHTITDPRMDQLAKIVFVADYIEPKRNFRQVCLAREIAQENLDAAVLFEIRSSIKYMMIRSARIHPAMLNTYNALYANNSKLHDLIQKLEENWK